MGSADFSLVPPLLDSALRERCPKAPFGPSGELALACFDLSERRGSQSWVVACDGRFRVPGVVLSFRSGAPARARILHQLSLMEMAALEVFREETWSLANASHEEAMGRLAAHCARGALRLDALEAAALSDPLSVRTRISDLRCFIAERSLPDM